MVVFVFRKLTQHTFSICSERNIRCPTRVVNSCWLMAITGLNFLVHEHHSNQLLESIGIYWNLLESIGIYWNLGLPWSTFQLFGADPNEVGQGIQSSVQCPKKHLRVAQQLPIFKEFPTSQGLWFSSKSYHPKESRKFPEITRKKHLARKLAPWITGRFNQRTASQLRTLLRPVALATHRQLVPVGAVKMWTCWCQEIFWFETNQQPSTTIFQDSYCGMDDHKPSLIIINHISTINNHQ